MFATNRHHRHQWLGRVWLAVALAVVVTNAKGVEDPAAARYRDQIEPILVDSCYACHGDGLKKGGVAFDGFPSDDALLRDRELWFRVLKNVRAGLMPPAGKPRPAPEETRLLEDWIKRGVFGIDPADPDPGRVTIRRLNRVEYRNTIRDLLGFDFRADEEFPPDDTGYGFDTIGDVLTVSPLLLEKYIQAAETIVTAAVPTVSKVVPSRSYSGYEFRGPDGNGGKLSFYKPAQVSRSFRARHEGTYRLVVTVSVRGAFDFDPGRCKLTLTADGQERIKEEFGWANRKKSRFEFTEKWSAGEHPLVFTLVPVTPVDKKVNTLDLRIDSVVVEGPQEPEHWDRPKNFDRFFSRDDPGKDPERREYAREVIGKFAKQAFRRPVEARTLDRLTALAQGVYQQPGKSVEQGIAQALIAVLASPRFLFRVEDDAPGESSRPSPLVDEYALATRLSYFLWSTMPDEELFRLAERGALRKNLASQVKRLLDDSRSERLVRNFAGQWLQTRDVDGIAIDAREVLARDSGAEKELKREREEFRAALAQREADRKNQAQTPAQAKGQPPRNRQRQFRNRFPKLFGPTKADLDGPLRDAMRRETEMFFAGIVHDDRSVLELLDSDYTYLNERLAKHYGIRGVKGDHMRRVKLPSDSPRGGLLTQGSILVVTSNPTRTSPVKRGLFLLDNILGSPPPPPPADVADLEASEKEFPDREPTLREVLELHRSKPLCNSCHSRMDPLGLALENFNALGMWRDTERNQPLDTAGKLITGEPFRDVRALKKVLKTDRRRDFYRCLTEKLLTYALGRGLEWTDVEAVDQIVDRLDREQGRFSALLLGIVESAPFQKRRNGSVAEPHARPRDKTTTHP